MSAPHLKSYRVRFRARAHFEISIEADCEKDAIRKAAILWHQGQDDLFTSSRGETEGWVAEPGDRYEVP